MGTQTKPQLWSESGNNCWGNRAFTQVQISGANFGFDCRHDVASADDCKALCLQSRGCEAVDFFYTICCARKDVDLAQCEASSVHTIYTYTPPDPTPVPTPAPTPAPTPMPTPATPEKACRPGQDIKAGTFVHLDDSGETATSDEECNQRCLDTPGCTAWVRPAAEEANRNNCWLHGGPTQWEADRLRNSGVPGCQATTYTTIGNGFCASGWLHGGELDEQACKAGCDSSDCTVYCFGQSTEWNCLRYTGDCTSFDTTLNGADLSSYTCKKKAFR